MDQQIGRLLDLLRRGRPAERHARRRGGGSRRRARRSRRARARLLSERGDPPRAAPRALARACVAPAPSCPRSSRRRDVTPTILDVVGVSRRLAARRPVAPRRLEGGALGVAPGVLGDATCRSTCSGGVRCGASRPTQANGFARRGRSSTSATAIARSGRTSRRRSPRAAGRSTESWRRSKRAPGDAVGAGGGGRDARRRLGRARVRRHDRAAAGGGRAPRREGHARGEAAGAPRSRRGLATGRLDRPDRDRADARRSCATAPSRPGSSARLGTLLLESGDAAGPWRRSPKRCASVPRTRTRERTTGRRWCGRAAARRRSTQFRAALADGAGPRRGAPRARDGPRGGRRARRGRRGARGGGARGAGVGRRAPQPGQPPSAQGTHRRGRGELS